MPSIKKIILVTATHHPLHKLWVKLAHEIASQIGVEKEVRYEDYVFLTEHGATDEYGMSWVPQMFAELEDGTIKLLLAEMPIDASLQPDYEKAKEEVLRKIREITEG